MSKSRSKQPPLGGPPDDFEDGPDSAAEDEQSEVSDTLWQLIEGVQLDARQRKLVWSDGKRLSFDESVARVREQYADFTVEEVERFLISWIENYAPEDATEKQLDELDRLADAWVDELEARES